MKKIHYYSELFTSLLNREVLAALAGVGPPGGAWVRLGEAALELYHKAQAGGRLDLSKANPRSLGQSEP